MNEEDSYDKLFKALKKPAYEDMRKILGPMHISHPSYSKKRSITLKDNGWEPREYNNASREALNKSIKRGEELEARQDEQIMKRRQKTKANEPNIPRAEKEEVFHNNAEHGDTTPNQMEKRRQEINQRRIM